MAMTIDRIITKVKENNPSADEDLLQLAYDFADKAHAGQKRNTGEPYIQHSLHTAYLLAQMKADPDTVIAGILHDVPEDTDTPLSEIEKNFGEEVAFLVEGITKLSKVKYRGVDRYNESLRKMFLAMAQDLRVILIKFADRLHNLRTIEGHPMKKRPRIANETMEIYAPIAGLLGVWRLKWQLEDMCFKVLYPNEYKKLEYKYEVEKKVERNQYTQKIKNILGYKLTEAGIDYEILSRFKHLWSIHKKMLKKDRKFDEIYDVFALRVVVPSIADCYKALGIIHSLWKPKSTRIKDYIAVPKPNGYRSLHTTVFGPNGKATEFQIRTKEMNDEAQYGIAAHWYYKQKSKDTIDNQGKKPRWVKDILNIQKDAENSNEFVNKVKFDIFKDRIFVFTPKGDVFDLPENSTAVDFAYSVHTEVGNKAVGALINDKMSTLDHVLINGDMIEIITDKNRKSPSRDWLKFVKTNRAKDKIKSALKNASTIENIKKFIIRK